MKSFTVGDVLIRAYHNDWEQLLRMHRELFPEADERWLYSFLQRRRHEIFVADHISALVGYIALRPQYPFSPGPTGDLFAYVEAWWVDPDFRGRGLGRALQRAAYKWARDAGFTELGADVVLTNEASHSAHRSLGYQPVETVTHYRRSI